MWRRCQRVAWSESESPFLALSFRSSCFVQVANIRVISAKLYEIGAGTSEVRRMVIGRAFNKLYKDA
jgi:hypothetical protein